MRGVEIGRRVKPKREEDREGGEETVSLKNSRRQYYWQSLNQWSEKVKLNTQ